MICRKDMILMFKITVLRIFSWLLSSIFFIFGSTKTAGLISLYPHYISKKEVFDISQVEKVENKATVMSFNIRCFTENDEGKRNWYYRGNLVIENIKSTQPDIIGFQEVTKKQLKYLSKTLKGYNYVFKYRDTSSSSESCPIYYREDKYTLLDEGTFWLSETPDVISIGWNSACPRICTYTILEEKANGKQLIVFNIHLDHISEEARIKGIDLVLDKVQEFGNLPAILMGDFNAYDNSKTYKMATEHLLDTKYQTENTMDSTTFQSWGTKLDTPRIDYIMISKDDFLVDKYFVQTDTYDGVYPSDHFPVCSILQLK